MNENNPIVSVSDGKLRGQKRLSCRSGSYFSFQGIPYAKPPVGELRFKAPQPPDKWEGIRDALKEGSDAPGFHLLTQQLLEDASEDCLYLNVYTPKLPETNEKRDLKAVMFWIHGGGFNGGSGSTEVYGPDYLVSENVVLVTINYRLGVLGFLSLGSSICPGNNGLKDMILALKWVRTNISAFGGDPNNVAIFGESAGGAAVQYLLLSPKSKGLFHKAISQSGSAINPWASSRRAKENAFRLGEILGFETEDEKKLLEFLKNAPLENLTQSAFKISRLPDPEGSYFAIAFGPVVEPESDEAFITKHPEEILKNGDIHRVPCIIGANTLEGLIMVKLGAEIRELKTDRQLKRLIPPELNIDKNGHAAQAIVDKIREFYFPNGFDKRKFIDILSCVYFLNGIHRTIEYHSKYEIPTYAYQFDYEGQFAFKNAFGFSDWKGSCHADELVYLFKVNFLQMNHEPQSKDYLVMEKLVKFWTNFAKTGNPSQEWKPIAKNRLLYMEINENPKLKQNFQENEMKFWKQIFEMSGLNEKSKL